MNYNKLTKAELIKALTSLRAISESAPSVDAQQRLLQELQVYQIELEMQNRELREAQQKLEASRDRYADLYDFAPTGYMTLDKKGGILEINLTGAAILGVERSRLLGMPFFTCVAGSESQKFREHLRQCKRAKEKVITELRLTAGNGKLIEAQLSSLAVQDPKSLPTVYHTVMTDITERKRAEEILQKRTEQNIRCQAALLKLTKMDNSDWLAAQKRITEEDAKTLEVERVSIWLFNEDRSEIVCEDLYRSSRNDHAKGLRLQARQYPRYFRALEENRTIAASDARRDRRTNEFTEGYLKPFAITSMMDVPVWLHGKVVGIVCHEHTGPMREWQPEDEDFAASTADLVSVALEALERQRAEAALRESEQRFRLMADDAPVMIWESGTDALCTFFNKPWLNFTGRSMALELGNGWAEGVHPDDLQRCLDIYQSSFNVRRPFEMEYRLRRADGEYRWVSDRGAPRLASNGEFAGFIGSCIDITVRKQAEEEVRKLNAELERHVRERTDQLEATVRDLQNEIAQRARAEEYFRSLIENASDIISVANANGTIRYESPSLERVLGYKPDDMIGKNAFDLIHPDDLPHLLDIFDEVIKAPGTMRSAEYRARHQDGSWRFFESAGKTLRDETGAMMIVVNSRDITERKRIEAQIQFLYRTTQAVNQAANFHAALGIALREICTLTGWEYGEAWVPSADGKRLECSPAWHSDSRHLSSFRKYSEALRYEANQSIPGRVWSAKQMEWMNDLASQPGHIFRRASIARESGLKSAIGVPILADGEVLAVLLFFSTEMRVENQCLITLFSTVAGQLGITLRRKLAEQELITSHEQLRGLYASLQSVREEERTRVAREIHDELGQMLTALKIDLSWLAKRLPASQEPLLAKTDAMSKLTDMTIASVKRISAELRPGLLDHLGLAEAIAWQAGQFRERTGIECKVELAPESINLDRERATILFRIVQEALTNVARHAQATNVIISLTQRMPKLLLKVRDNGKGITPEQILDPHSFGLIGIRERVHPWGGKIKITGVPGKGTVVFVSLPVNTLPIPIFHHQSAIIRDKQS